MRIVITGGCGFLGRRLALLLLERGSSLGPIDELVLFDNAPPALPLPDDKRLRLVTGDIADRDDGAQAADRPARPRCFTSRRWSAARPRPIPISAIGSISTAPARCSTPAARSAPARAWCFASSLAVYGGALPPSVGDDTPLTPQSSYGTQKAIGELLVNDYSRKGFVDGRALRLPTVVVRPGPAEPRRFDLCLLDHPRAAGGARCGVPGLSPIRSWPWPRRAASSPRCHRAHRSAGSCLRLEPLVAASGLFGRGRRDGGGSSPRRRRGSPCPYPLGARPGDPADRLRLAAGARRTARRSARLLPPTPASTRPCRPLSRTIWRRRSGSSDRAQPSARNRERQPPLILADGR